MIPAELLLHAYRQAIFPMALEDGEVAWFSPDPRAIIPIEGFHVPHGLRRTLKKGRFEVRVNTAFALRQVTAPKRYPAGTSSNTAVTRRAAAIRGEPAGSAKKSVVSSVTANPSAG